MLRTELLRILLYTSLALATLPVAGVASPISFSGSKTGTSGETISAQVTFDFVTHDFGGGPVSSVKITLANTATLTSFRGNLITGVFFSLPSTVGNLPTGSAGFDGLAARVVTNTGTVLTNVDVAPALNNTATDGGYQLANGPFGNANNGSSYAGFRYGISTIGGGLAGFTGRDVNNDDYGIFAPGSTPNSGGLAAARPLIDSSVTFWIARPSGWTALSQVSGVRVTYGSLPDNNLDTTPNQSVPEPSSAALIGLAAAAFGARGLRGARRRNHPSA